MAHLLKGLRKSIHQPVKGFLRYKCRIATPNPECPKMKPPCRKPCDQERKPPVIPKPRTPPAPECCQPFCPDEMPRFDDLYYSPSDKRNRKYQQTWAECPKLRKVKMAVCCYEKFEVRDMEKRKPSKKSKCADPAVCLAVRLCQGKGSQKCPKLYWPFCKAGRKPSRCLIGRKGCGIPRPKTPYPSFSECLRNRPAPLPPSECRCLIATPPFCELHY